MPDEVQTQRVIFFTTFDLTCVVYVLRLNDRTEDRFALAELQPQRGSAARCSPPVHRMSAKRLLRQSSRQSIRIFGPVSWLTILPSLATKS